MIQPPNRTSSPDGVLGFLGSAFWNRTCSFIFIGLIQVMNLLWGEASKSIFGQYSIWILIRVLINCEITNFICFYSPPKKIQHWKKNKTTPCVYLVLRELCPFHGTWITFGLSSGNQMWLVGTSPNGGLDETSSNWIQFLHVFTGKNLCKWRFIAGKIFDQNCGFAS